MTPQQKYQYGIASKQFIPDPAQEQVVKKLQEIYKHLHVRSAAKFPFTLLKKRELSKGLYLWGPVGAGKTLLMDLFFESLTNIGKQRLHFHEFMRDIHQRLRTLQGQRNPLTILAKNIAKNIRVLCFDEFFVTDIADAMLLAGLLKALFAEGIVLIATSNSAPDNLYRNGLQRERFLPAIQLIKQFTTVMELPSKKDYRLRTLEQAQVYYAPINATVEKELQIHFLSFAGHTWQWGEPLIIANRRIPTVALGERVVWFDFNILCHSPRSQIDYLEIAQRFAMVIVSNVPKLTEHQDNQATYLINLIDILYDAKVKLIIAAEVPLTELYVAGRLKATFQRTLSRLIEMQSTAYLHGF